MVELSERRRRPSKHQRRWVVAVLGAVVALLAAWTGTAGADGGGMTEMVKTSAKKPVVTTAADWQEVAEALGRPGVLSADGLVYRVTFPRDDLKITSDGVRIKSAFAVGTSSYAAFSRYPDGTVELMGDLLTTDREQARATDALRAGGMELTAVHKHLPALDPDLWWNHFHGTGSDPAELATTVHLALNRTGTPAPTPCAEPAKLNLNTGAINTALGASGTAECGVYSVLFQRNETIVSHQHVLAPAMGVTSVIFFQPLGGGRAAISGDFALTSDEVQDVIDVLRAGGIRIVALHQHGFDEQPQLYFMHYWAKGDATTLARTLGAAVQQHNVSPLG